MTDTTNTTGFGKRLANARHKRGHRSTHALADAVKDNYPHTGITHATVVNLELGITPDPTVREVIELAQTLALPPAALIFDLHAPFDAPDDHEAGGRTNLDMVAWFAAVPLHRKGEATSYDELVTMARRVYDTHQRVAQMPEAYAVVAGELAENPDQLADLRAQLEGLVKREQETLDTLTGLLEKLEATVPDHMKQLPDGSDVWAAIDDVEVSVASEQPEWSQYSPEKE